MVSSTNTNHSNFLWLAEKMLSFTEKYKDKIQIAFKPHPNLKKQLISHPGWGKPKVDEYYDKWNSLDNGQLEEGDYFDLFLQSDAMIHDSVSFLSEYLYTMKPCCYVIKNENLIDSFLNDFGKAALELHDLQNLAKISKNLYRL